MDTQAFGTPSPLFAPTPFGTPAAPGTLGLGQLQSALQSAGQVNPTPAKVPTKAPQNERELATYEQARQLAAYLTSRFQGTAIVLPGDDEPSQAQSTALPGIYVPAFFGYPPPSVVLYKFLHLRFANGAEGLNVGLIIDKFSRYPMSPGYVLGTIAAEVGTQLAG